MATITARVSPSEAVTLFYAKDVEHLLRYGEAPARAPVASVTADTSGLVSFSQPSRIEFLMRRASGAYVKLMDSTTRGGVS